MCCQAGKDKTWIVDLDKEYLSYEEEIKEMILDCEPYKRMMEETGKTRDEIKKEFFVVPTKSGKHIIVKPFNRQMFSMKWKEFNARHCIDLKEIDIHKDNPTILFVP
jgi:hypothetical protein